MLLNAKATAWLLGVGVSPLGPVGVACVRSCGVRACTWLVGTKARGWLGLLHSSVEFHPPPPWLKSTWTRYWWPATKANDTGSVSIVRPRSELMLSGLRT